jgi:putative Mg2+ transporter-C (MgtC) family protein
MALMPLTPGWPDVALRIVLSMIAGALIGLNRDEAGKGAGLRTTLLVCLAACLAMLQVNALLAQAGKAEDSFVTLDLMRLPLGILSGVGFIGAGAILRKDGLVKGVTTAATLWFVTVVGLLFGGGQIALGLIGLVLGFIVLWCIRHVERSISREIHAELRVSYERARFSRATLAEGLKSSGCRLIVVGSTMRASGTIEERFDVRWRGKENAPNLPPFIESALAAGASELEWTIVR